MRLRSGPSPHPLLADRLADGTIIDAALAQSGEQQKQIWRLREDQTEVQKKAERDFKHDVAVPVANVPSFCAEGAPTSKPASLM